VKVLVRFKGDNDFGQVMKAFGTLLLSKVQDAAPDLTPQNIADWFNDVALTLFMMTSRHEATRETRVRLEKYLRITPEDVYIDLAADEKLTTAHQWANYDSVMIDGSEHARERVYLV